MIIDATDKFATATASFLLKSDLTRVEKTERLKLFHDDHVKKIGQAARVIKGK